MHQVLHIYSKMNAPRVPSDGTTSILILNDDCLIEVFKWLNSLDLCAVADTCGRLRQNAKAAFEYSKNKNLRLWDDILPGRDNHDFSSEVLLKLSKMLRHFGEYIVSYDEEPNKMPRRIFPRQCGASRLNYSQKMIDMLNQYCSANLSELRFASTTFDDETAHKMRALLRNVKKLSFFGVRISEILLKMLPWWCPELRELRFFAIISQYEENLSLDPGRPKLSLDGLHQPLRKLVKLTIDNVPDLKNNDIEQILKLNPQLREIGMIYTPRNDVLDDSILNIIAKHVPLVESLNLTLRTNVYYGGYGRLHNLRSLKLRISRDGFSSRIVYVEKALREIHESNIPLKNLHLDISQMCIQNSVFVGEINKLKELEVLEIVGIHDNHLKFSYVNDICKHSTALSELALYVSYSVTPDKLLELIGNAKKLKSLHFISEGAPRKTYIRDATFMKIVDIVEKRCDKTHLKIKLDSRQYTLKVSNDLVRAYNEKLTVLSTDTHIQDCYGLALVPF